jgi:hypothetical protein
VDPVSGTIAAKKGMGREKPEASFGRLIELG